MDWGTDDTALITYENDNGERDELPGNVDRRDSENVVEVRADKMDVPDFRAFPRGESFDSDGDGSEDSDVRALDAEHWSETNSANGSVTVSDADTDLTTALNVASSGIPNGETVKGTFSDVSISDDAQKRFLQTVVNVNSVASGALVEIVARDDDGDEKILKVDPAGSASDADVVSTGTGNGYVAQQRMGDLPTNGTGEGSFDSIQEVEIRISDADADVTLTAFNAEKMDRWEFGSYIQNEDSDDETRVTRYEPGAGTFTATGLDTFSSELTASGAVFYDVSIPVRYTMEKATKAYEWVLEAAEEYPGYEYILTQRGKVAVPTGYDLMHSALEYTDKVSVPSGRYKSVSTAEGVENTAFEDITWTSQGSKYDSQGATVTLNSAPTAGTTYAYEAEVLVTESNWKETKGNSGGGAAPQESGDGGGLMTMVAAVVTGILGFLGLKSRGD
jgi:hypothetical protein